MANQKIADQKPILRIFRLVNRKYEPSSRKGQQTILWRGVRQTEPDREFFRDLGIDIAPDAHPGNKGDPYELQEMIRDVWKHVYYYPGT